MQTEKNSPGHIAPLEPSNATRSEASLLLVDKGAVEALLRPDEVLLAVRQAFTLHSRREGRVFPVVREGLSTAGVLRQGN